jgi:hypothetical protein
VTFCFRTKTLSMEKMSRRPNNGPIPWQRSFPLATVLSLSTALSLSSRAYSDFLLTALTGATYVVLPKENHMQLIEAATLDRKSGEAEGSAVFLSLSGLFSPSQNLRPQIFDSVAGLGGTEQHLA